MSNNPPLATDYAGVREYIGARYVPVFANPIEWSNTREYEPLTIVTNQGNSYTSTQYVPTGIDIGNTEYWALTSNFNAQIEAYRKEVADLQTDVDQNIMDITELQNKDKYVVLIGDSFTDQNNNPISGTIQWPSLVDTNKTIKNYAYSGSSFVRGEQNSFLGQLQKAYAEGLRGENIDKIIIYGGVNDYTNMQSSIITREDVVASIKQCEEYIKTNFNNAPHIFCLTNIGLSSLSKYNEYLRFNGYLDVQCSMASIPFITCYDWLIPFNRVAWLSDNLHPSPTGAAIIAGYMEAIINDLPMHTPYFTLYDIYNDTVVSSTGTTGATLNIHYAHIYCQGKDIHGYISATLNAPEGSGFVFSLFPNNGSLTLGSLSLFHPCPVNVYNLLRNCFWSQNGTITFATNSEITDQTIVFQW